MQAGELLKLLAIDERVAWTDHKLNNVHIPGFKDIGPNGWIIFILRKHEDENDTDDEETQRID